MVSWQTRLVNGLLRVTVKRRLAGETMDAARVVETRSRLARLAARNVPPPDVSIGAVNANGVAAEWVDAPGLQVPGKTLLYLHGGAYTVGDPTLYRMFTWRLAAAACCRVLAIDYRLAPEHPYPAAVEDAVASYRWLLENGHDGSDLALAGDSAGGNLVLVLLQRLRAEGLPLPASALCYSPWTDLTGTGASVTLNARRDPMLPGHRLREAATLYAPDADHRDPLLSPLFADFRDLPPLAIHVGSTEVLLDDALRVADRARAAGVKVELSVWRAQPHVFPLLARFIPEGRQAIAQSGRFLLAQWLCAADLRDSFSQRARNIA
ncbi:MAG: alpha/beta hydrolase [Gammaproteobacteria bacterium]|nr:MAG: alpha/beta hydrolase [Gammaproteobacteria bacterium]